MVSQSTANNRTVVGVISDTHGLLRPEAIKAMEDADLILHAGDIGTSEVIQQLSAIAPVHAVRGNNDKGAWASAIPESSLIQVGRISLYILHDVKQLARMRPPSDCQVIISGHSHKPSVQERGGILFVNPGSAGPRRFKLPVSVARLIITGSSVKAAVTELSISP